MNDRCKQLGGYLVQTETNGESVFLVNYLKTLGANGPYFTGITDEESEGTFYNYNDKRSPGFIQWRWFQPDNWWNEDCVEIWYSGYNDRHCGTSGRYICEVPA
ncbi:C-type lectin domain family 4 member m [Plakobranchus ocellatus]|uniref:C-type lectin domain family 4 member m n=1 Tax=Plakobranchus ocellatus TaxID=259542 RepID=A0AAV3Y6G3_9GAST|nr:C-type lectin domain family 4 member m [Plakobranchus ocellatus]GFO28550.1 C-type lectin domain family 4 member m [Plakobranchus ocellatus]